MASVFLPIVIGAWLWRRHRLLGAAIGLVIGVLFGPLAVNLAYLDEPFSEKRLGPIPQPED